MKFNLSIAVDAGVAILGLSFFLPHGLNTLALVLVLVLGIIERWGDAKSKAADPRFRVVFWPVLLFTWILLSFLWSESKESMLNDLTGKLSLLVFPLIVLISSQKRVLWFKIAFVFACCAALFVAAVRGLQEFNSAQRSSESLISLLTYEKLALRVGFQAIYFSMYLVVAFFLTLFSPVRFWVKSLILLFLGVGIIMLSSRMETLVFALLSLSVLLYQGYKANQLTRYLIVAALGLAVTFGLILMSPTNRTRFAEMMSRNQDFKKDTYGGRALRLEKWRLTLETYRQHVVLGTGMGDYRKDLERIYQKNDFTIGIDNHYNSHNQYLQTLTTLGPLGLIFLLMWFLQLLLLALRERDKLLFACLFIFALSMISESMLERQRGIVFMTALLGLLLGAILYGGKRESLPLGSQQP